MDEREAIRELASIVTALARLWDSRFGDTHSDQVLVRLVRVAAALQDHDAVRPSA